VHYVSTSLDNVMVAYLQIRQYPGPECCEFNCYTVCSWVFFKDTLT